MILAYVKDSAKRDSNFSFTERLLRCGNTMEILHTRKTVRDQLTCLIRGIPSTNVAINLRFITDAQQFERAMKESFGVVRSKCYFSFEHSSRQQLMMKLRNYRLIIDEKCSKAA